MTTLSITLYILAGLFLLLALILFSSLKVSVIFKDDFYLKAYFGAIKVYDSNKPTKKKKAKSKKQETPQIIPDKNGSYAKQIFKTIKEKRGFVGAIKEIMNFLKDCLSVIKPYLKKVKINKICLNISYGSFDAAETAVNYGIICTAVYPVLDFFDCAKNIGFKKIDIKSDFENQKSEFDFSLNIKAQVIFLLIIAFKIYKNYKNFLLRNDIK